MGDVVSIKKNCKPTLYWVEIEAGHHSLTMTLHDVGDSDDDRRAVADNLEAGAAMIRRGLVDKEIELLTAEIARDEAACTMAKPSLLRRLLGRFLRL